MSGHGWVTPNANGTKARCGGPGLCPKCSVEALAPKPICGVISNSGPNGEPLACGYLRPHDGEHSWATLPTFTKD